MGKVVVVGAGPSGIMAALKASECNEVILLEKNTEIGKKLKITGGGRCNITNNRYIEDFFDKVVNNKKFLYSSLYSFTNEDMLKFLENNKIEYKIEKDEKIYTKSDRAEEVIEVFLKNLIKNNIKVLYNKEVVDILIEDDTIKGVKLSDDQVIEADSVVISTGGKSYPGTGSNGSMFNILKKYHSIEELTPALVPLVVDQEFVKKLQGISLQDIVISCKIKKKKISMSGDILFAHFGLTGPVVLNLSSYINKALKNDSVELNLDLAPNVRAEEISAKLRENPMKNVQNNIKGILPQNFIKILFEHLNIGDVKGSDLTKKDEEKIISNIKNMTLICTKTRSIEEGIVTSGGVSVKEINSSTMESKKIKNLYFTGEVIDVDAQTGGYNLQIAYSTGYLAGMSINIEK